MGDGAGFLFTRRFFKVVGLRDSSLPGLCEAERGGEEKEKRAAKNDDWRGMLKGRRKKK